MNDRLAADQLIDDGCQNTVLKACWNLLAFAIRYAHIDGRKGASVMFGCSMKVCTLALSHDLIIGIHAGSRIRRVMRLASHDGYNATLPIDDGPRVATA